MANDIITLWQPIKHIIQPVSVTPREDYRAKIIAGMVYYLQAPDWRYWTSPQEYVEMRQAVGLPLSERWQFAESEREKYLALRWKVILRTVTPSDLNIVDQLYPEHRQEILDALKIVQPEVLEEIPSPAEQRAVLEEYEQEMVQRLRELPETITSQQFNKLIAEDQSKYRLIAPETWSLKQEWLEMKPKVEVEIPPIEELAPLEKIAEKVPVVGIAFPSWAKWALGLGAILLVGVAISYVVKK
ncbi:MAG: hypothetical protein KJ587_19940 [Alphaproteobacteria bacterium]|nr:hypothetical protein [Alphaproteobacteria bacterium]